MESDSWTRLYLSQRRHQLRSDAFYTEDCEGEEEQRPQFICPFCVDDFDVVGLCCHIDEEHEVEAMNGSLLAPPSHTDPDALLTSFMYTPPNAAADDDEPSNVLQPLSYIDKRSVVESSFEEFNRVVKQSPLSVEDMIEHTLRCEFVQELLLSTFIDDGL